MSTVIVCGDQSAKRPGDCAERWARIPGFEDVYSVSDHGAVFSHRLGRALSLKTDKCGYLNVSFKVGGKRSDHLVHRLVASAFIQNPSGKPNVNHIDLCKSNNHYRNLEWVTHQENMDHYYTSSEVKDARIKSSKPRHSQRILSTEQARRMRLSYAAGYLTLDELSRAFQICRTSVYRIVTGATYAPD